MKILALVCCLLISSPTLAGTLFCNVIGSDDHFILYPEQEIWSGREYRLYALMDGLTIAAVHRPTLRYNRLTNLNLPQASERLQLFSGQCQRGSKDSFENR